MVFAIPLPDDWSACRGSAMYVHTAPAAESFHAMALVGHDEDRQAFRLINSWGPTWGDHGYAWVELYQGMPTVDAQGQRSVTIGTGGPTQTRFQVDAPFGDEIVLAIASPQPLFGSEIET